MEERMYLLMAKMLSNEATDGERRELNDWLEASDENKAAFDEVKTLWQKTDIVIQEPQFNFESAWEKVAAKTTGAEKKVTEESPQLQPVVQPMRKWWAISAAAAGLIIIALAYNFMGGANMVSQTATDGMLAITLPDQSHVNLKPGSTLTYPEKFDGDERKIELQGEAFFEVTRNEQKPFIVEAQSAEVRVLGTSFNVSCTDSTASVAVRTGKVQMSVAADPEQKLILTPGNKGVYEKSKLTADVDTNFHYYATGELIFDNHALEQAIAIIAKVKSVNIIFDKSVTPTARQQKIRITFKNYTLVQMLDEICLITDTRWKKENNKYVIYAK